MTKPQPIGVLSAEEMRRAFDESFGQPIVTEAAEMRDFLAIRAGDVRYALPLSALAGFGGRRKITPLPASTRYLLGIAGIQGRIVPVYQLALLTGNGEEEEPEWLALCGNEEVVAFAFGTLDGYLRVPTADICDAPNDEQSFVREVLRIGSEVRFVLDVPALLRGIQESVGIASNGKTTDRR